MPSSSAPLGPVLIAFGLLAGLPLAGCSGGGSGAGTLPPTLEEFRIEGGEVAESSGLARSQRDPALLCTHNDSGGNPEVHAVDVRGQRLGTLTVSAAMNADWEDMASYREDGAPRLLLADIGDNYAVRPLLTLYIVEEPELAGVSYPFAVTRAPLRTLQVRYPDGPRDAESIAVDEGEGFIYILSKRDPVPRLYRLPLHASDAVVTAEALGEIRIPRAADTEPQPERINWTTAMDFDEAGSLVAIATLTQVHLYRRAAGQSWRDVLQQAPLSLDLPDYPQIEAAALSADGRSLWISSEGVPAPLARLALPR